MENKTLITLAIIGLAMGILCATYQQSKKICYIKTREHLKRLEENTKPKSTLPKAINLVGDLCRANPKLGIETAILYVDEIEKTLGSYPKEKGVADKIKTEHIVSVIIKESGAREDAAGSLDEIGLMQIRPLHTPNLEKAGVISTSDKNNLWNAKNNIRSGIFIIMQIANRVDKLERVFSIYNAGFKKERFGRRYAQTVIKAAEKMEY